MNFLSLTNRVLKAFNEVQLTSTTFSGAQGFYAEAQDSVNQAILDIYTEEDTKWPFAWLNTTFTTNIGQQAYTLPNTYFSIDWDSFYITKPQIIVTAITLVGGIVNVTTSIPHQMFVGDAATLFNINDNGTDNNTFYNGNLGGTPNNIAGGAPTGWTVTAILSPMQFQFTVGGTAPIPSLGSNPYVTPPYQAQIIDLIDYNTYKEWQLANDINGQVPLAVPSSYNQPASVVRLWDNSIILTPVPDRMYSMVYGGYTLPTPLALYSDIPIIPPAFEQVIVDKALYYAYMFRDNAEEAAIAGDRYTKNVNKMRRILIPQTEYMRFEG